MHSFWLCSAWWSYRIRKRKEIFICWLPRSALVNVLMSSLGLKLVSFCLCTQSFSLVLSFLFRTRVGVHRLFCSFESFLESIRWRNSSEVHTLYSKLYCLYCNSKFQRRNKVYYLSKGALKLSSNYERNYVNA